jgi:hypothetical protein
MTRTRRADDNIHGLGEDEGEAPRRAGSKRMYLRRNMLPAMASIRREDPMIHMLGEEPEGPEDWGKRAGSITAFVLFVATILIS